MMQFFPTTAGEDVGLCRVDSDTADVVRVSLKHVNSLQSVVIEHTDQHIVLRTDKETDRCVWSKTNLSGNGHCLQRLELPNAL